MLEDSSRSIALLQYCNTRATPLRREVPVQRESFESKIVQPLTNRHTKLVVLAFESSGWTDFTVQKLVNVWEQQASRRLGPDRRRSQAGSSTRHELSSEIQYWNSVSLILRPFWCQSPRTWMMGGRPSVVE